ncbi:cobalamin biosynthesis protein, partial [Angustibacter aerolatus]
MQRNRAGRRSGTARALGLLAGVAADALLGDPRRWHPVAGFGQAADALQRRVWADSRARGAAFTAVADGAPVGLGLLTRRTPAWMQ